MSRSNRHERLPHGLRDVADLLRDERPTLDPLALDRIKVRAMGRARRAPISRRKGIFMRSRLTTLLTIAFFGLGTGGAVAFVGGGDLGLGGHHSGSASFSQYRPGWGCSDKNHTHTGPPGNPGAPSPCHH